MYFFWVLTLSAMAGLGLSPWFKTVEASSAPKWSTAVIYNDRSEPLFGYIEGTPRLGSRHDPPTRD